MALRRAKKLVGAVPEAAADQGMLKSRYYVSDEGTREDLWRGVADDPTTGVAIVTLDGHNLFCNDAMARMHHGPNARGKHYTGIAWDGKYPKAWIDERVMVLGRVQESGKPLIVREIWEGRQRVSYIRQMTSGQRGHFLVISRYVSGRAMRDMVEQLGADVVESSVASLGPLEALTGRELEVLALIGQGLAMKEIASMLELSVKTVEKHREAIGRKVGANDRVRLAELAFEAGLTRADAGRARVNRNR